MKMLSRHPTNDTLHSQANLPHELAHCSISNKTEKRPNRLSAAPVLPPALQLGCAPQRPCIGSLEGSHQELRAPRTKENLLQSQDLSAQRTLPTPPAPWAARQVREAADQRLRSLQTRVVAQVLSHEAVSVSLPRRRRRRFGEPGSHLAQLMRS